MELNDTWKTSLETKFCLFQWLVIPFGLTNAHATFTRLINDILHPHLGCFIVIYIDAIFIFNCTWGDHLAHVCLVLELQYTHTFHVKCKKSFLRRNYLSMLGFILIKWVLVLIVLRYKLLHLDQPFCSNNLIEFLWGFQFLSML